MMDLEHLRRSRWIALATLLALAPVSITGCATEEGAEAASGDEFVDEIANVNQSTVKRQAIGNCWIYATTGWVESMHRTRTNQEINISESYLTYWDWFEKITTGSGVSEKTEQRGGRSVVVRSIETGGSWYLATTILKRRGLMMEGDFIPEEATAEMSARQSSAQTAINTALSEGGELARAEDRRNPARVIPVLNRAWGLSEQVTTMMSRTFGARYEKRLDGYSSTNRASVTGTSIRRTQDVQVRMFLRDRSGGRVVRFDGTLGDAVPGGRYAWREISYPGSWNTEARPETLRRGLAALNEGNPVIISWLVDFNALNSSGAFNLQYLQSRGMPGRQGGHLTVLHDYQVTLPNGRVLAVGQNLSASERSMALTGTVQFLRVKNSWGASRADRASIQGYYDLDMAYLNGPIAWVGDGGPSARPTQQTPFNELVIPPGF